MSDSFERDSFEREREAIDEEEKSTELPEDDGQEPLEYPERLPIEASEADVLEQSQTVDFDEDAER